MHRWFKVLPLALLLACVNASASVGEILFVMGNVTAETPQPQVLRKGDAVDAGYVIVTGPRGYAQIKLADGTRIAVRPDSRFAIEAVEAPATPAAPAIGAGTTLRAHFSLQKGGFRTLTGGIARQSPAAYQVSTPSAVIRIRGTNYSARMCAADCGDNSDDGLYVGVSDGGVTISNNGGDLDLSVNQYGYAQDFNTEPQRLLAPPASLSDENLDALLLEEQEAEDSDTDSDGESTDSDSGDSRDDSDGTDDSSVTDSSGSDTDESGGAARTEELQALASEFSTGQAQRGVTAATSGETTRTPVTNPATIEPEQPIRAESESGGTVDITDGISITRPLAFTVARVASSRASNDAGVVINSDGTLAAFEGVDANGNSVTYRIGGASQRNAGQDPITGLKWGRWSEGVAGVQQGTSSSELPLGNASLHWITAPIEQLPAQQITGSASYVLVGNTDPTNNLGHVGILGTASLSANFTNASVTSSVAIGINNQVWEATGSGSINARFFSGLYNTVNVGGSPTGSGSFEGMFSGFNGAAAPTGAGMTYQLNNGSTTVNGSAVFNQAGGQP